MIWGTIFRTHGAVGEGMFVGILHGYKGKLDRAEYHEYLGRKYK
jgi:hypothetical protein